MILYHNDETGNDRRYLFSVGKYEKQIMDDRISSLRPV